MKDQQFKIAISKCIFSYQTRPNEVFSPEMAFALILDGRYIFRAKRRKNKWHCPGGVRLNCINLWLAAFSQKKTLEVRRS